ncbi:MAG: hypothetical protein ABEH81_02820 [Halopenitus sp.]
MPALLAGCLSEEDGDSTPSATTSSHTPTPSATPSTTPTETEQPYDLIPSDPASMTTSEVRERLAARDCSALVDLPTTCPDDDARLRVSVSPTVGSLRDDAVEFTVQNPTDEQFKTSYWAWVLRKWDGSQWRRLAPLAVPGELNRLAAGDSHTHRINTVANRVAQGEDAYMAESDITIGGLGPGVYGFSYDGYFESEPGNERAVAAVFGFAGEGPPVRPTDGVSSVEREGSELVVSEDPPADDRAEFVVSFTETEADSQLLSEHVHQLAALSNTLPYAATEGVETIRFIGHTNDVDLAATYLSVVTPEGTTRYGFHDLVFETSSSES